MPASPMPSGSSSEMGWSYVRGPLTGLHVCHGVLSYRIVWSSQVRICQARVLALYLMLSRTYNTPWRGVAEDQR
jgi:hypothetical protein